MDIMEEDNNLTNGKNEASTDNAVTVTFDPSTAPEDISNAAVPTPKKTSGNLLHMNTFMLLSSRCVLLNFSSFTGT